MAMTTVANVKIYHPLKLNHVVKLGPTPKLVQDHGKILNVYYNGEQQQRQR